MATTVGPQELEQVEVTAMAALMPTHHQERRREKRRVDVSVHARGRKGSRGAWSGS